MRFQKNAKNDCMYTTYLPPFAKNHVFFMENLTTSMIFGRIFLSNQIHKISFSICLWASDPFLIDLIKIHQLKGLKPKNKGYTKSYERFVMDKKVCLMILNSFSTIVSNIIRYTYLISY